MFCGKKTFISSAIDDKVDTTMANHSVDTPYRLYLGQKYYRPYVSILKIDWFLISM